MLKRKIILFGGTFDPIHLGHTIVAAEAVDHISAEKIIFIPAKQSPLKSFLPKASDLQRMEMITLAIAGNDRFESADYELNRPTPSYTIDTIKKFQSEYGSNTTIYWLIGADVINELYHWYRIVELLDSCNLSVMYRAGTKVPDFSEFTSIWGPERTGKLQKNVIKTSLINISSTEIRNSIATGKDISSLVAPAVAEYIKDHNLYTPQAGHSSHPK